MPTLDFKGNRFVYPSGQGVWRYTGGCGSGGRTSQENQSEDLGECGLCARMLSGLKKQGGGLPTHG